MHGPESVSQASVNHLITNFFIFYFFNFLHFFLNIFVPIYLLFYIHMNSYYFIILFHLFHPANPILCPYNILSSSSSSSLPSS